MFWEINFVIDTGYDWKYHVCVVAAKNEEEARKNFDNWISPRLHGENFVVDTETKIVLKRENEYGIIYQSCFAEDW